MAVIYVASLPFIILLKKKSITFHAELLNSVCYDYKHLHSKILKANHAFFFVRNQIHVFRGWTMSNGSDSAAGSQKNVSPACLEGSSQFLLLLGLQDLAVCSSLVKLTRAEDLSPHFGS